jgi:hypothetical protein
MVELAGDGTPEGRSPCTVDVVGNGLRNWLTFIEY